MMRHRFLRLLVAFALALAVPLQGFAAASAGICVAFGHHHGDAAHSHDADIGHADHHYAHDGDEPASPSAQCAPCVACCGVAAISSCAPPVVLDDRAAQVDVATAPASAGIPPDRLDRPPLAL